MKSIILCEGSTDFVLLQYFLREAYHWIFGGKLKIYKNHFSPNCVMDKDGSTILLGGCGGCSKLIPNLEFILDRNSISAEYGVSKASISIKVREYREECQTNDEAKTQLELMEEVRRLRQEKAISFSFSLRS